MEHIKLYEFPSNILFEIVSYLEFKSLINLTTVCKSFNDLIGFSSLTMDKIKLKIEDNCDFQLLFNSGRKYTKIQLMKLDNSTLHPLVVFLNAKQASIKKIQFYNCKFSPKELRTILLTVRNGIEELDFEWLNVLSNTAVKPINFQKLTKVLFYKGDLSAKIFNFFKGCKSLKVRERTKLNQK